MTTVKIKLGEIRKRPNPFTGEYDVVVQIIVMKKIIAIDPIFFFKKERWVEGQSFWFTPGGELTIAVEKKFDWSSIWKILKRKSNAKG